MPHYDRRWALDDLLPAELVPTAAFSNHNAVNADAPAEGVEGGDIDDESGLDECGLDESGLELTRFLRERGIRIAQGEGSDVLPPQRVDEIDEVIEHSRLKQECNALFGQAAVEGIWWSARSAANMIHPGAGELLVWAYRAVHAVAAVRGINSGDGFDLSIDVLPTPVPGLAFAFSIREMQSGDEPAARPRVVLDVSFTEFATINGVSVNADGPDTATQAPERGGPPPGDGWDEWIELFSTADRNDVLVSLRTNSPLEALSRVTAEDRRAAALALLVTLDRQGHLYEYKVWREHAWRTANNPPG